jgi:uncharacterized protein (DUF362 family)
MDPHTVEQPEPGAPPLTRRQFGLLAAGAGVALACGSGLEGREARAARREDAMDLSYTSDGEVGVCLTGVPRGDGNGATTRAVRRAALAATDFGWLSRGDRVLIKPACNSGNAYPATTDPEALAAMVGLLKERGAGRVIVADMSGVQAVRFSKDSLRGSTRALMERCGMARAVDDAGGEIHAFEEAGWDAFHEEAPTRGDSWSGPIRMPAILAEVDHIVLMPRCARHLLAGSTLGLKAAVGWWRHDTRLEYHRDAGSFSQKTAEANTIPTLRDKQRLVLSSATRVLTTFGPDNGYIVTPETGLVMAAPSVVAHDMASLAWLLEGRRGTPAGKRDGLLDDPNRSGTVVNLANRLVVTWLGGVREALRMQRLERYDLQRIWDDRVLTHAFQLAGGVPRVQLVDVDGTLPAPLLGQLEAALQLPA